MLRLRVTLELASRNNDHPGRRLSTHKGCQNEKEYLLGVFQNLRLQQTLHLRFCHIMCCIERNTEHKFLVAQWDSLKVAWILLKEALERFEQEEQTHALTSRQ